MDNDRELIKIMIEGKKIKMDNKKEILEELKKVGEKLNDKNLKHLFFVQDTQDNKKGYISLNNLTNAQFIGALEVFLRLIKKQILLNKCSCDSCEKSTVILTNFLTICIKLGFIAENENET